MNPACLVGVAFRLVGVAFRLAFQDILRLDEMPFRLDEILLRLDKTQIATIRSRIGCHTQSAKWSVAAMCMVRLRKMGQSGGEQRWGMVKICGGMVVWYSRVCYILWYLQQQTSAFGETWFQFDCVWMTIHGGAQTVVVLYGALGISNNGHTRHARMRQQCGPLRSSSIRKIVEKYYERKAQVRTRLARSVQTLAFWTLQVLHITSFSFVDEHT
jgi:hypothetical protein